MAGLFRIGLRSTKLFFDSGGGIENKLDGRDDGAFESGSHAVFASFSENVFADEVGAPDIGRLVFGLCVESGGRWTKYAKKSVCRAWLAVSFSGDMGQAID